MKAASKKSTSEWFWKWEGEASPLLKEERTSSVAILFSKDTAFQVTNALEDPEGRFLLLNGTTEDQNVTFRNVYAPSGYPKYKERSTFFNNLKTVISEFKPNNSQLILGGDFNCVLNDELDRIRPMSKYDPLVKSLNKFYLDDIWRNQHPENKEYTFYSNIGTGSRLDKFYIPKIWRLNVTKSVIESFSHSDHEKVSTKIDLNDIEMGPGIWKMNNVYLKDQKYIDGITDLWYKHQETKFDLPSLGEWWDEGKLRIQEFSTIFSKQNNKRIINMM